MIEMIILTIFIGLFLYSVFKAEKKRRQLNTRVHAALHLPKQESVFIQKLRLGSQRLADWMEKHLVSEKDKSQLRNLLLSAGYFHSRSLAWFLLIKFGSMAIVLLIGASFFHLGVIESNAKSILVLVFLGFGAGVIGERVVQSQATSRQEKISRFCPDAMDMLVICAEAGTSIDQALIKVSQKISPICPEIAHEFRLVVDELRVLPNRGQAFKNLAERSQVEELKMLATTLLQAMNYGSSIAKTLRIVASDTRDKRLLGMEEKAAKIPAKMGLPLIILVLFPTLVLIAAPAMLKLISTLS